MYNHIKVHYGLWINHFGLNFNPKGCEDCLKRGECNLKFKDRDHMACMRWKQLKVYYKMRKKQKERKMADLKGREQS